MSEVNWLEKELDTTSIARSSGIHNCPNCAAPINSERCPYCGTLFVDFAAMDADKPFFMKIKKDGSVFIAKVVMNSASIYSESDALYADDRRFMVNHRRRIALDFDIIP